MIINDTESSLYKAPRGEKYDLGALCPLPLSATEHWVRGEGLVLTQGLPLGDLLAGVLHDFVPLGSSRGSRAVCGQHQPAHHLVFGGAVEVQDQELHGDVVQQLGGHVEDEGLVEHGVECALLDMCLLFGDALSAEKHIDLHVRV